MKNSNAPWLWLSFLAIFFSACTQELINDTPTIEEPEDEVVVDNNSYPGVDQALWPYFARFEEEAQNRGFVFDLRALTITGVIEEIDEDGVAGQCNYFSHQPNHVTIDLEFWNRASDRGREFVVFHELGHCVLARDHREAAFSNGTCRSIMRSGVEDCRDNYSRVTRSDYLNELYDPRFRNTIF